MIGHREGTVLARSEVTPAARRSGMAATLDRSASGAGAKNAEVSSVEQATAASIAMQRFIIASADGSAA